MDETVLRSQAVRLFGLEPLPGDRVRCLQCSHSWMVRRDPAGQRERGWWICIKSCNAWIGRPMMKFPEGESA